VELPRVDTGWGGGTCPRSSEVDPEPVVDGGDVRGRAGGPSRSRDVEVVDLLGGGGGAEGAGPDRSSDVLAAAPADPAPEPGPDPADGGRACRA